MFRSTPPSVGFAELSTAAGGSGTESFLGQFRASLYTHSRLLTPGTASGSSPTPTSMCLFLPSSIVYLFSHPLGAAMSTTIPAFLMFSTAFIATIILSY